MKLGEGKMQTDAGDIFAAAPQRAGMGNIKVVAGEDRYELVTDLSGANEEDLFVSVCEHVLSVTAAIASEACRDVGGFLLVEHRRGLIEQSFALPLDADAQDVESRFDSGILTVTIGRRAIFKPIDLRSWHSPYAVC